MFVATYYKIGAKWFLDYPEYLENGGDIDDLERIGGFEEFLELAARGGSTVNLQIDYEPFEGADVAALSGTSGAESGAYYYLNTFEGQPVNIDIWLNSMIYMNRKQPPEKIYFKVL